MFAVAATISNDDLLKESEAALVRGDHEAMRALLEKMSGDATESEREKRDALLKRIAVDRVQVLALLVAFLFFLAIAYKYVL